MIAPDIGRRQSGERSSHFIWNMVRRVVHEKIKRRKKEEEIKLCMQRQRLAVCVSATRWGNCTKNDHLLAVNEIQKLDNIAHEISDTFDTDSDAITVVLVLILFIAFSSCRVAAVAHRPPLSVISLPWSARPPPPIGLENSLPQPCPVPWWDSENDSPV